ncbi:MAG: TIR domain-containing protein [Candidatus Symbiobacter sp.]|nr:TIR domain-containing protein [Candidatus Symbiobacter sp.]
MSKKTINIFISHSGKDAEGIDDLKALISSQGIEFRDFTPKESDPNDATNENYIKYEILKPRIEWCSILIVYLTKETNKSDFVKFEIEQAAKLGKKIIGVYERGSKECEVPQALKDYGDYLLGWNTEKILKAINSDEPIVFENPDGSPKSKLSIPEYVCRT